VAMDDLDRLLAETMRDAAEQAPSDEGLLNTVHRMSGRYRRQRLATVLSALAAVLAVGIPTVVVLVARTSAGVPAVSRPAPSGDAVRLVAGWTAPVFPYTLPAAAGLKAPVTSIDDGNPVAFFEATEQLHHADTTVTVSSQKPAFAGSGSETPVQVRGHSGILRTVDVHPAKKLIVYWPESPGRWIQLATDDTYTQAQVVALADSLEPASVAVLPPFRLDLSPAGFVTGTVTESTMSFRPSTAAPATDELRVVLRKHRPLATTDQTVGPYPASLTHDAGRVTLDVDVTDWNATLEVTAGPGLAMSDADLLRFAAGVHILDRSNPQ
jgi:hypothetical protein